MNYKQAEFTPREKLCGVRKQVRIKNYPAGEVVRGKEASES